MVAFVIFASADGITKVTRCKSTFRSSQDPACSMLTTNPDNAMMCTSADVFAEVSGYFSVAGDVEPLCVTYIFKSDPPILSDDFPEGIWLFRGVNFDSRYSTCEHICQLVRDTVIGTNYKSFYVSCTNDTDGNSENVTDFWQLHTQYDCSTDDKYYSKDKPIPNEVTTTIAPSTSKASSAVPVLVETFAFAERPVAAEATPAASEGSSATLFIGIAQGVIGVLGTAIIATSAVVLYLTLKKLKGGESGEDSQSE